MNGERYECERCGYVLGSWDKMSNKYLDIAMEKVIKQEVNDVLDKIRAEIHATAELHEDGDYYLRDEWIDTIFDKYKAESSDNE